MGCVKMPGQGCRLRWNLPDGTEGLCKPAVSDHSGSLQPEPSSGEGVRAVENIMSVPCPKEDASADLK